MLTHAAPANGAPVGVRAGMLRWAAAISIVLAAAVPPAALAQDGLRLRLEATVDSIAAAAIHQNQVAGLTVIAVQAGDTLLRRAYGFAEVEGRVPTPDRAIYEAGSIAKQFTAAAILLLEEDGRLDLDDPLSQHLPDFQADSRITVRHLLHHTSGLPDYTELPGFALTESNAPARDDLLGAVAAAGPLYAPGEAMVYANTNYLLLALVVEAVADVAYADFVGTRLLRPAGMVEASYCDPGDARPRRVRGHRWVDATLRPLPSIDHGWSMGAGSLCASAEDLIAWTDALHGGRILAPASYATLVAPGILRSGLRTRYAAGLMVDSIFGRAIARHAGSLPGFRAYLAYFPDEALGIVVITNTSGAFNPAGLGETIARVVLGAWTDPGPRFRDMDGSYIGTYLGTGREGERLFRLSVDDSGAASWVGRGAYSGPLYEYGPDLAGGGQVRIHFVREGSRVVGAWLDEVGEVVPLRRAGDRLPSHLDPH